MATKQNNKKDIDFLNEDGYVTINTEDGGDITLIGTVHVSKSTRERVMDIISELEHDVVAIELDSKRLYKMLDKDADFSHGSEDSVGLKNLLSKYQDNKYKNYDNILQPGEADMIPAVEQGIEQDSEIALVDMSVSDLKSNIKSNAITNGKLDIELFNKPSDEILDNLKSFINHQKDMANKLNKKGGLEDYVDNMENAPLSKVKNTFGPLEEIAPEIIDALIDERDKYMAGHLLWLHKQNKDVISVMGKGHLIGVYNYLQNPEQIPEEYIVEPEWYNYTSIDIV